jgi:hypothetical protein
VWAVLEAHDLAEATTLLSNFPVLRFAQPSITELAFYNAPGSCSRPFRLTRGPVAISCTGKKGCGTFKKGRPIAAAP